MPCLNGGKCVDLRGVVQTGGKPNSSYYECVCEPGYTGKHCEIGTLFGVFVRNGSGQQKQQQQQQQQ